MNYWQVTVQLEHENDRGRTQRVREIYLTEAESATEAEAKIYKEFEGESNFTVVGVNQSKILKVIE
jgi:tRNA A37 N6-isopentenylltransferase MiaA